VISLAGKVTVGLVDKITVAYHRFLTVTCELTAKKLGWAPCRMLVIDYETTLLLLAEVLKSIQLIGWLIDSLVTDW